MNAPPDPEDVSDEPPFLYRWNIYKIYAIIVAVVLLIAITAWIDARCCRINDYFKIGFITRTLIGFLDFLSDLLFALKLTMLCLDAAEYPEETLIATIAAYIFIALPIFVSFKQLIVENKREWIHSAQLRNWMKSWSYVLNVASIITGSAYNAVALANSQMFNLSVFSMGLTKDQMMRFSTQRIFGVVMCEVKSFNFISRRFLQKVLREHDHLLMSSMLYTECTPTRHSNVVHNTIRST